MSPASIELASAFAIDRAKSRGDKEVTADDLLVGGLFSIARFGVAALGEWKLDLEDLGLDWTTIPNEQAPGVTYSAGAVEIFDQAVRIAKSDGGGPTEVEHLLAAFASEETGLMEGFKRSHGITSAGWRAALAERRDRGVAVKLAGASEAVKAAPTRDYLSPEEAATALGVHVQTLRGYIRSGKLPALRVAGERAIRIRREDLDHLLEPLQTAEPGRC